MHKSSAVFQATASTSSRYKAVSEGLEHHEQIYQWCPWIIVDKEVLRITIYDIILFPASQRAQPS